MNICEWVNKEKEYLLVVALMNKLDRLTVQKEEFESQSSFHTYFKNREKGFYVEAPIKGERDN